MGNCGIYKITNNKNGKVYIGSSKEVSKRQQSHWRMLKNNQHHSYKLQSDYNKFGLTSFSFEVIEVCELNELLVREQYWMDHYQSYHEGYNCTIFSSRPTGMTSEMKSAKAAMEYSCEVEEVIKNLNTLYRLRKSLPENVWVSLFDLHLNDYSGKDTCLFKRYAKCSRMMVDVAEFMCGASPEQEYRVHYINYIGSGSYQITPKEPSTKKSRHDQVKSDDIYALIMSRLESEMGEHKYGIHVLNEFKKQLWE